MEPVRKDSIDRYITIGKQSYREHYTHLWKDNDCTPYIEKNFTRELVLMDLGRPPLRHFLVIGDNRTVGVVKLVLHAPLGGYTKTEGLLLEKLYLLAEFSGMGIGAQCLLWIEQKARVLEKGVVWLDTMQRGPALNFYLTRGYKIHSTNLLPFQEAKSAERAMYILKKEL